ncbi:schlafen family member 11-like isoform X1 [Melanerpes formicivorus]|uniref:schlafen family member 11-like isoform X1 n=1 Tax=Melanerpes formicivorus TaxID=211600 RepID=UPI00358FEBCA
MEVQSELTDPGKCVAPAASSEEMQRGESRPEPRLDLLEYQLQQRVQVHLETEYPEVVLCVGEMCFGVKARQKMPKASKQDQKHTLARALCALLNSGGGVVKAEIANEGYNLERDGIGADLEEAFRSLLLIVEWEKYLDLEQQGNNLLIFVKAWSSESTASGSASAKPRICSLSTGLYTKSGASLPHMNPTEALLFLTEKQEKARRNRSLATERELDAFRGAALGLSDLGLELPAKIMRTTDVEGDRRDFWRVLVKLSDRDHLQHGEKLPFTESRSMEFKHYSTDNFLTRVREVLPQYIAGFANADGGCLWIGVDDDGRVQGFSCDDEERRKLEGLIESIRCKLTAFHFCKPDDLTNSIHNDWDDTFYHIHSECDIHYDHKLFPVCGADGERRGHVCAVYVFPFRCVLFAEAPDSWLVENDTLRRVGAEEWAKRMTDTDPDLARLSSTFRQELSLTGRPPLAKAVYSHQGADSAATLCENLFPVRPASITYTPEKLREDLFQEHPGLDTLIESQLQPLSEGVLIFSRSWAVDVGLPANRLIICDVLQVAKDRPPILYTVCQQISEALVGYSRSTARRLKEKLVNTGGYTHKLCVIPKLLTLPAQGSCGEEWDQNIEQKYPPGYGLVSSDNLRDLLHALTVALLTFKSFLSDRVGSEFLNLLTLRQYQVLSENLHRTKKLYVYGLPGTGKTVVALKIMEQIRTMLPCLQEEVLYICETKGLKDFVRQKNICQAVTREEFLKESFSAVKHIIIDEAQSFRDQEGDWYGKALRLTSSQDLPEPGFLWIFLDYLQTSHSFPTGLPDAGWHDPIESLTNVVRSASSIYGYVREKLNMILEHPSQGIPIPRLRRLVERAMCAHPVTGRLEVRWLEYSGLCEYVQKQCVSYIRNGYSVKDIAVLYRDRDRWDNFWISLVDNLELNIKFVTTESSSWREQAVVDRIQNFAGLERSIVFGIIPPSMQEEEKLLTNLLVGIASRAILDLHLLFQYDSDSSQDSPRSEFGDTLTA